MESLEGELAFKNLLNQASHLPIYQSLACFTDLRMSSIRSSCQFSAPAS